MLKKARRLNKKLLEEAIKDKNGRAFYSKNIRLKVIDGQGKIAIIVPAKVSKKSTERNKLRRVGYAIIDRNSNLINKNKNHILFFKKLLTYSEQEALEEEIKNIFKNV